MKLPSLDKHYHKKHTAQPLSERLFAFSYFSATNIFYLTLLNSLSGKCLNFNQLVNSNINRGLNIW